MEQKEILELIEQWEQTDPVVYKANIKAICHLKGIKPRHIVEAMQIPLTTAKSFTNASHKARIEFKTALQLAELLGVDIKDLIKNIENI
jgi:plasmid maintenance system antidote protein VapI